MDGWEAPNLRPTRPEVRVRVEDPQAVAVLGAFLRQQVERLQRRGRASLIVLCIGSDRSTGDALGPLVGSLLLRNGLGRDQVAGDLGNPVHASNLRRTWADLVRGRPDAAVLAVDACLGRQESVGTLAAGAGPLRPGAGVNKDLPAVGDLYLTGTVNVSGFMEYFVLQNTRLSLVVNMAEKMAAAILSALSGQPAQALRYPGA
jgi:putative sporulation protein YyaC